MGWLVAQLAWAWFVWGLLIGQAIIIAAWLVDRRLIDNPWGATIIAVTVVVSGMLGVVGETLWHSRKKPLDG